MIKHMVTVNIIINMVLFIKGSGLKTCKKAKVMKYGLMEASMKVGTLLAFNMDTVSLNGMMMPFTLVNG